MHININQNNQRGIGMVEVLVALLLLAVGVLGFSALQSYAVYATTESLNRTQALTVMRGLAERIRVNDTTTATLSIYKGLIKPGEPAPLTERCTTKSCNVTELATVDIYDTRAAAWASGIQLGMDNCPGTVGIGQRQCLLAAWDKTTPTIGVTDTACMDLSGVYLQQATCIVMEIY